MKVTGLLGTVVLASAAVSTLAAWARPDGPDPVAILRAADAALKGATSISCTVESRGVGAMRPRTPVVTGTVKLARIDVENPVGFKFVTEGELKGGPPGADGSPARFHAAYDGKTVRSVRDDEKAMVEGPGGAAADVVDAGAGRRLAWVLRWEDLAINPVKEADSEGHARYDGEIEIDGVRCHAIHVDYSDSYNLKEIDAWWYIGIADSLPRKLELHYYSDEAGDGFDEVTLRNLAVNSPIDAAAFVIAAPPGYEAKKYQPPAPEQERERAQPAGLAVGSEAPDWTLKDPQGKEHKLSDYRGQVVVMDFWATWCPPCREAMPGVQKIHVAFKGRPVQVFGINCFDDAGDPVGYMKQQSFTYGLLLKGDQAAQAYGVSGIPVFCVVGVDGKVLSYSIGYNPDNEEQITQVIEEHLKQQGK